MRKPVLFRVTNNLKVGGVERRLRSLLPLLMEHYEVHIVTYRDKGIFFEELGSLGVKTHFLPRKGHWNPLAIIRLAKLFRECKADIVHTHSLGGNIFGLLAAALARVPVRIGQVHTNRHWYGSTPLRRKKQMFQETIVHRLFSHKVLFVSRESRDYFKKCTNLPESMLQILHNGLTLPDSESPASRSELGLPEHRKLIGFVGRLVGGKGVEKFLDMAREACSQKPQRYHFVIIGDGGGLSRYKNITRMTGITQDVTFLGERLDIHRCYGALDCLAFCSAPGIEGMPGVVLEACAHGLPILAQRSGPIEEIREYYKRINFINDTSSVADQLEGAMALPPDDKILLRREFSIEAMRDRTLSLYDKLYTQVLP